MPDSAPTETNSRRRRRRRWSEKTASAFLAPDARPNDDQALGVLDNLRIGGALLGRCLGSGAAALVFHLATVEAHATMPMATSRKNAVADGRRSRLQVNAEDAWDEWFGDQLARAGRPSSGSFSLARMASASSSNSHDRAMVSRALAITSTSSIRMRSLRSCMSAALCWSGN